MSSTKLGALVAMFVAAQALGQTTVQYTLEIGGDNHAAEWKNPTSCLLTPFTSGGTADGTPVGPSPNCTLTWAARVSVTGTYSVDGQAPFGVSNVVFNLELRDAGNNLVANFGKGSATTKGFFSSINDGTANTGACYASADPDEAAAFPISFNVDGSWNGRLIDSAVYVAGSPSAVTGGPGLTYFQYPSTLNFPGGSTCPSGTLCGVGAGYPQYTPNGCPDDCGIVDGFAVAGLGYYTGNAIPSCDAFAGGTPGLGDVAIVEGQINAAGLADGTYTLVLVPGTGTNLIKGGFDCLSDPGAFAVAASTGGGDQVLGDTISFSLTGCGGATECARTIVGRHLFYNNSFYDTASTACNNTFNGGAPCDDNSAVAPNVVALLPGQAPIVPVAGTEGVLSNYSSYILGINGIMVDVQYGVDCAALPAGAMSPGDIASTFEFVEGGRSVANAYTGAVRVPTSVTIAPHPTLPSTDRITIIFADDSSTNSRWLRSRVLTGGAIGDLGAEDVFYFGLAKAEGMSVTGTNALVGATDLSGPKPPNNHTTFTRAPIDDSYDYDRNSLVNAADQNFTKPPNNTTTFTCLQLTGVAP